MSLFPTYTFTVTRYDSVFIEDGIHDPVQDVTSTLEISTSLQPADGKLMETLPENRRDAETYVIYPKTELFINRLDGSNNELKADRVTINGSTFEVIRCEPWQNNIISHYKAIVSKIDGRP